jgi:hypothetical protein
LELKKKHNFEFKKIKIIFLFSNIGISYFSKKKFIKNNIYIYDMGIGDWAQSPIPNPQSPIPNPHINKLFKKL